MASAAALTAQITPDLVRACLEQSGKARFNTIQFVDTAEGDLSWRSIAFLVRCRENGFMVLLPNEQEIIDVLDGFPTQGSESCVKAEVVVAMETPRGRALGNLPVLIADLPWYYLSLFRKTAPRSAGIRTWLFRLGGTVCKPSEVSAGEVAAHWISDVLEGSTGQEYTDAMEALDGEIYSGPEEEADGFGTPETSRAAELKALREKVAQLESLVSRPEPVTPLPARAQTQSLMGGHRARQELSAHEVQALRHMVGPPPKRLGKGEVPASTAPGPEMIALAEADRGVSLLEDEDPSFLASLDPMQRLFYMQIQQTNQLIQTFSASNRAVVSDPLAAVLNAPDSGSAGSSGASVNVKGYVAREAYLRQLEDTAKVASIIRANARLELGVSEAKEEPSLMRTYLETRVDHRLLAQMGYILAWGWEQAAETNNTQMLAFCGRMMTFVEQAALDNGRSALAWLLTGLPEINYQALAVNKRRQSLTPFAKLPVPAWVAANVSFLKDVDTFETRLRQIGTSKPFTPHQPDPEEGTTKPKPKPKKPKGGSKGTNAGAEAPPA